MMTPDTRQPALEPDEILPPETGPGRTPPPPPPLPGRIQLLLVGLLVDALDFLSWGPAGLRVGFPVGALLAFYLLGVFRFPLPTRILLSLAAGAYCALPGTNFIPLGTLLALLVKRVPGRF